MCFCDLVFCAIYEKTLLLHAVAALRRRQPYHMTTEELKETAEFISEYATCLLGSGVHTSRVLRNSTRICDALGVGIQMTTLSKTIVITVFDAHEGTSHTEVLSIPALPISFEYNADLSELSWDVYDNRMPLQEIKERYREIVSRPKMSRYMILLLVGLANGAFCRLFNGAWGAVVIVVLATWLGVFVRQEMQKRKVNHFIVFIVSAFVASMFASLSLIPGWTPNTAIGTSVLFLIPGVPLINGIIDIIDGHTLTGVSRLINAMLLIICVAVGLSVPLLLFVKNLL